MRRSPRNTSTITDSPSNTRNTSTGVASQVQNSIGIQPTPSNVSASSLCQSQTLINMVLTDGQFRELLGGLTVRQDVKSTFSSCTARFSGGRNSTKIEDFIATILVFKEAENISDSYALISLPLILEGYASIWWQGVKHEAKTFSDAIELLRKAFAPPKPDWLIFN